MDQAIFWKNENISLYYLEYYFQIYYLICRFKSTGTIVPVSKKHLNMYLCMFLGSENQWHCKTDVYWRKENKLLGGLLLESTIPAPSCSQLTFLNFSLGISNLEKINKLKVLHLIVTLWKNVQTFIKSTK